jgi:hypothetical protein
MKTEEIEKPWTLEQWEEYHKNVVPKWRPEKINSYVRELHKSILILKHHERLICDYYNSLGVPLKDEVRIELEEFIDKGFTDNTLNKIVKHYENKK